MDRRAFVLSGAALVAIPAGLHAQMPMRMKVAHPRLVRQECAEWCWAASASMIFASLGHPTDQKKIVDAAYNGQVCAPAQQTGTITRLLDATWLDDDGRQFRPTIEAGYDQQNNILALNHTFIVDELTQDRLMLYANTHHCMVVVEAYYFPATTGPNVVSIGVLDPWSGGPEFRLLTAPELVPASKGGQLTYLAAVRI
jgi:hypothetical protein